MLSFQELVFKGSFNPISQTMDSLTDSLKTFNNVCYNIFQFGNVIMFLIFLFMALNLFLSARETEYKEKINARNLEYLKKRGRIGTTVCVVLAIGFLLKGLSIFFLWCLTLFPTPIVFHWLNINEYYIVDTSLHDIYSYDTFEASVIFFVSILSFTAILMITLSMYLIFFNVRVVHSRLKTFKLLFTGIIIAIVCGLAPGFWLLR